jgi:glycosyltransferase involved in cell wall biosynthesis
MKRIALIVPNSFYDTGVSTYTKNIINALESNSTKYLLTIYFRSNDWNQNFTNINTQIYFYKSIKYFEYIFVLLNLRKIGRLVLSYLDPFYNHVLKNNYDLLLFTTPSSTTFFFDNNSITAVHDLMHLTEKNFKESSSFLIKIYRNRIYKNIAKNFNSIFVDSQFGKNMFEKYYNPNTIFKINVLPYSCPDYIINSLDNDHIYNTLDIDYGDYIFYPASFWEHKNHINLIKAFSIVKSKIPNINLVLTGNKNKNYKNIYKTVKHLNLEKSIFFIGFVDDNKLHILYKNSVAMIMPTYFGPTNIPPIESIYCNCPVLVSDIYGMREQLENAAIYFNPNNISSIAQSIIDIVETPPNDLQHNMNKIKLKFSPENFNTQLMKYINNFLNF